MHKKGWIYTIAACALWMAFAVLSILLVCVDVRPAGQSGARVGFATINEAVFEAIGQSDMLLTLSELAGLVIIAGVAAFAVLGLVQVIRRKGILRADIELYVMACGLVFLAALYVFFELAVINYRPVLEDGVLAASYPSSHTMLAVAVAGMSTAYVLGRVRTLALRITLCSVANTVMAVTVAGRLLGGVHWLTDILGGCLAGLAVVLAYLAAVRFIKNHA